MASSSDQPDAVSLAGSVQTSNDMAGRADANEVREGEPQKDQQTVAQVRRWRSRSPFASTTPADAKTQRLVNGFEFPLLGIGTWSLYDAQLHTALGGALKTGCCLIDTSSAYGNEAAIGHVLRQTAAADKVVIQSKIGPRDMGRQKARAAAMHSIKCLGHLDILLIHWPGRNRKLRIETWQVLEELYTEGLVRAIGVSNFLPEHIEGLLGDGAKVKPMINQFELHLFCQSRKTVDYCREQSIAIQSYSTLGGGPANGKTRLENGTGLLLGHSVVTDIAKETGTSCARVCLRWAVQQSFGVIPKSKSPEHIQHNSQIFDFALSEDQMSRLKNLDEDHHFAWDPRGL